MKHLLFGEVSISYYNRLANFCLVGIIAVLICFVYPSRPLIQSFEDFDNSSSKISVKLSGAVLRPGIYVVSDSNVTGSVIKMANNGSDLFSYNKPAIYDQYVKNGSEVLVFSDRGGVLQINIGVMPVKQRILLQIPLDINEMSEHDLLDVPGIGPGLANNILKYRQNNGGRMCLSDLPNISGIGIGRYSQLKKYFN